MSYRNELRSCEICGVTYRPTYSEQRTCSRAHGVEIQRRNSEAAGLSYGGKQRTVWPSSKIRYLNCDQCGRLFTAHAGQRKLCGDECRRRRLINWVLDRHYGFVRDATREGPLLEYLIKRDHGRCGICHKPVRALTGEMKPSIDHIYPRSLGGSDDLTNLQLAHWRCNRTKSNRSGGQALLIG